MDSNDAGISDMISSTALNVNTEEKLLTAVNESIGVAKRLGAKNLIITVGNRVKGIKNDEQLKNIVDNLKMIAPYFEKEKITLLVEPINLNERPLYLLPNADEYVSIIKEVNSEYIKILYDVYHQHMENAFDISKFKAALPYVGHIHLADCPGRNELGTGNADFEKILEALKSERYDKYVGLEFNPKKSDEEVLKVLTKLPL